MKIDTSMTPGDGIIEGFILEKIENDVPIVYMSIHWWNTFHPVVITMSEVRLDPMMQQAGLVALSAFLLLALVLLLQRVSIRLHDMITKDLLKNLREQE